MTKRIYSHDPVAQAAILLILFAVFNLLLVFLSGQWTKITQYLGVEPTRRLGIELLRQFAIVYAYLEYG